MNAEKFDLNKGKYYAPGIKLPEQDNYLIAYRKAADEFSKRDIDDVAAKSGARVLRKEGGPSCLVISFIKDDVIVTYPDAEISYADKDSEVVLWLKILLLHYLIQARGTLPLNEHITFKQITGGMGYYSAFQRRSIDPLIKAFGNNLNNFIIAAEKTGGIRHSGENSVSFQVFPHVNVIYNIWPGDEELPPDGNVVFDKSIVDYLSTEDIAVMCNMIAIMIVKAKTD